ncbi:MAG: trypsin-like serine peptidase [Solirubrobacterales bacterium]
MAAAVASAALLCPAATGAEVVAKEVGQSPDQIRGYWTAARMQSAATVKLPQAFDPKLLTSSAAPARRSRRGLIRPTSGAVPIDFQAGSETGFPQRVHGRVFMTIPGLGDGSCSGTLVASRLQNVVVTAGHCAYALETAQWASNFLFVPGYREGSAPFGEYPAAALLAPDEWTGAGEWSYDIAIAQLSTPLEAELGARGIAFNEAPRTNYQIFGYPADPAPYDGELLIQCDAPFFSLEYTGSHPFSTVAYPCNMQEGASGGGWVNPAGQVVSVSSHVYLDPGLDDLIVGPYFGSAAKRLYNRAGGSAKCPPAKQALTKAKRKARKVRKRVKRARSHRGERRARKRLRRSRKRLRRARALHREVC